MNSPALSYTRRKFLYTSGAALAATALSSYNVLGANDRVRVGMIGMGRRAQTLLRRFSNVSGIELVAICDPDTVQMDNGQKTLEKLKQSATEKGKSFLNARPVRFQDYRKLLERKDIDAVIVPSTNFWHTLHAIHGVQAGKHVYVEKPVTFTHWEGKQIEAASERYGKIIAPGYQNRSDPGPQEGIRFVQEGNLGKILKVRALCYRNRDSIGKISEPLQPPPTMDYDLWLGPAAEHAKFRPQLHYDWHWDFHTGNGDMGNQSVHEIDMVYWLLGHPGLPTEVQSYGNRFAWNDGGNTPNLQIVWCRWGGAEVILETNDLKLSPERNVSGNYMGIRVGIVAECERGFLKGGRGGMVAVEPDGKTVIQRFKGNGGRTHFQSFIDAVRANDATQFPTNVAKAHVSESVMHLGNASYRLGDLQSAGEVRNDLAGNDDILEILRLQNQQLGAWGIDDPQYHFGKRIRINPKKGKVKNWFVPDELTGPHYRKGYEVPELA